jgi:uncharacterized protein YcfJ
MNIPGAGLAAAGVLVAAMLVGTAQAHHGDRSGVGSRPEQEIVYAPVVDVQPVVRRVRVEVPVEHCWDEVVYRARPRRGARGATIAGGLIGGLVGNQFGSGSGKTAATVAGGLLGAGIAGDVARRGGGYEERVTRCETGYDLRWEEHVQGYDVTYRYRGRRFTTRTREHPGERIALRLAVTPLG